MIQRLGELACLFLKLGTISFGGPAAHVALMEDECVRRRGWLSRERFLDLWSATYLIPGPNATEMASQIGYHRAGVVGSFLAAACFTLPAALISAAMAWVYLRSQGMPEIQPWVDPVLAGIKPVVLAIILAALLRLAKTALAGWDLAAIGIAVAAASWSGANEIGALLGGGALGAILLCWTRQPDGGQAGPAEDPRTPPPRRAAMGAWLAGSAGAGSAAAGCAAAGGAAAAAAVPVTLAKLALFFFKVGAVLYGSGYVLIAYLEGGLVREFGWLTEQELVDAVAVGQITPGPLLSTVTFIGYLKLGGAGAAVATVAFLLPGLCLVALVNPWIARLRQARWPALFLDAVGAAAVGLTAVVTVGLGRAILSFQDWRGWLVALAAGLLLWRTRVAAAWLVLAGALAGAILW